MQRADQQKQNNGNAKNESGINQSTILGYFKEIRFPNDNKLVPPLLKNDAIRTLNCEFMQRRQPGPAFAE
jgi:hypothetical protein